MEDTKKVIEALEAAIDSEGLPNVLRALAAICSAKAEHLESTWQAPNEARDWTNAASKLERVATLSVFTVLPAGKPPRSYYA